MKNIKIYQLKDFHNSGYGFMSFEFAKNHGFKFSDYKLVYESERGDNYECDNAFEEFNLYRPKNFKGHSLSVSDIVELNSKKWYCDSDGWCEVY